MGQNSIAVDNSWIWNQNKPKTQNGWLDFRLAYSRKMFVVAYLREAQEMVMDAHNKAFTLYGGVPLQMIYDNPKTIMDTVFVGKERKFSTLIDKWPEI